ncbi:HEAT repeat domain-containing protein [Aquirufa antheringensis]|uniref:C-type cytochrome n=1 Tax=Aquirufa antheringensis TaxID=2516559 RepID=A0A4Q9BCF3_9BACT|nr:HEAT repeat domain-containing protein [Aquirufa antheringensis]MCZ2485866.1 c-type cytochrome [Aquirufa antheringensis]TBH73351.1 c-type cytochrome [Aquirufa antheringensis]
MKRIILLSCSALALFSCSKQGKDDTYKIIYEDQTKVAENAKAIKDKQPIKLIPGLKIDLWASDSLLQDPVAIAVDDKGAIFVNSTNRNKASEFDIRGHRDWMTESIGFQTVEDRRAFLHRTFAPENSAKNTWLPDMNGDGSHDWLDLKVEKEEIYKVEDLNGDGYADQSTRVFNGFNEEVTDVAGGLLVRKKDAFVAIGPDLMRLKHKGGQWMNPESISTGYAVHIGFGGHGMSGVTEGPDGKIYWQIGDIGANITAKDGKQYKNPNSGVIVRSNPDGSEFEVYASGLRNTHEFVFDNYGNLISSDNDGDHPGESERLVHVVEGSDAGWRSNWQYGKYTDPRNNQYKVWMDEKLYVPRWEGQAAYIIPPIRNFHNGPTGMLWNPGTALGKRWTNKFFLVEFVGNANMSHIWSFDLKPKGASFDFKSEEDVIKGILPTGIRFGPEGALYASDWIFGWDTKNYGRIWKIDVDEKENDLKAEREQTKQYIQQDYAKQSLTQLYDLLFYADQRVRLKAQYELAERKASATFVKAVQQKENQLARVHGIWGLGQIKSAASIQPLLADTDEEIVAQAAKALGDIFDASASDQLIPLVASTNPRVSFFAAQALGRIRSEKAIPALLKLVETNADKDLYLRHAAVLALSRIGQAEPMLALQNSPNRSLRIAAVLVLRRLAHPGIQAFLQDSNEYIVAEAARAINDDESIPAALPALAATLADSRLKDEVIIRRAINACLRVGSTKEIELLIAYSERTGIPEALRAEAIATLGSWANPSVMDRVDGRHRGVLERNPADVIARIQPKIPGFLASENPDVLIATAKLVAELQLKSFTEIEINLFKNHPNAKVRAALLSSLAELQTPQLGSILEKGISDEDKNVRGIALSNLNKIELSATELPAITKPIFEKGSLTEQQSLLQSMAKMKPTNTSAILADLIQRMVDNQLPSGIKLDLMEAVEASNEEKLVAKLDALKVKGTLTDEFKEALYGGSVADGRNIFNYNSTVQCVRCHIVGGEGTNVGPNLKGVASRLTREQLLQALIEPSARISPGYGTTNFVLTDGQEVSGSIISETDELVQLKTNDAEPLRIPVTRIKSRENLPSGMPPMGSLMSKREIRDVVEYLSSLK